MLDDIKIGDTVIRFLAGTIREPMTVSEVTSKLIVCGAWAFDKATGDEVDKDLDWGPPPKMTGSYITRIDN